MAASPRDPTDSHSLEEVHDAQARLLNQAQFDQWTLGPRPEPHVVDPSGQTPAPVWTREALERAMTNPDPGVRASLAHYVLTLQSELQAIRAQFERLRSLHEWQRRATERLQAILKGWRPDFEPSSPPPPSPLARAALAALQQGWASKQSTPGRRLPANVVAVVPLCDLCGREPVVAPALPIPGSVPAPVGPTGLCEECAQMIERKLSQQTGRPMRLPRLSDSLGEEDSAR